LRRIAAWTAVSLYSLLAAPAFAAGSGMPWEAPLKAILDSITGPVVQMIAVVIIAITGLTLAFGDTSGGFRKLIQIVFGLTIAFEASSFFLNFFNFTGGAGKDVLDVANAANFTAYTTNTADTLASGDFTKLTDIAGGQDITTAAGLLAALNGGEYALIDATAAASTYTFVTASSAASTTYYVFNAVETADASFDSVTLIGIVNGNAFSNLIAANVA